MASVIVSRSTDHCTTEHFKTHIKKPAQIDVITNAVYTFTLLECVKAK